MADAGATAVLAPAPGEYGTPGTYRPSRTPPFASTPRTGRRHPRTVRRHQRVRPVRSVRSVQPGLYAGVQVHGRPGRPRHGRRTAPGSPGGGRTDIAPVGVAPARDASQLGTAPGDLPPPPLPAGVRWRRVSARGPTALPPLPRRRLRDRVPRLELAGGGPGRPRRGRLRRLQPRRHVHPVRGRDWRRRRPRLGRHHSSRRARRRRPTSTWPTRGQRPSSRRRPASTGRRGRTVRHVRRHSPVRRVRDVAIPVLYAAINEYAPSGPFGPYSPACTPAYRYMDSATSWISRHFHNELPPSRATRRPPAPQHHRRPPLSPRRRDGGAAGRP